MKKIDENLLQRLQTLSMIQIKDENRDRILEDLNKFLEFVDVLDELDISSYAATYSPIEASAPLRKDIPQNQSEIGQKILRNAPKSEDDFFIVPKIIE
ncbi:Asp-tRNA(Asn)/Glu-tRNA(Gln) amidotransferase subunit GatC [Nitratiruptor tergarcus]|uniref:Aspartyl/glutamyl-tRNA(Asn/Gln) amidotransferase subunit C n=1 Tax=Nitratiruptor tergarcus DSM 16512 TaxID=1069081 RepID=A0A1W1WT38_9BACT|nr:Asp-tRNA(Asn)/Glu-tRNA(Gln) amidotransferase subunit GatC [Nitratiruptor tergarcus]SMC09365.1 aspartyl/glutamyl-tRNA(Asn/Gln) amidotransferase subunit C [Nitratiruptor tergarcus DSM 16512]